MKYVIEVKETNIVETFTTYEVEASSPEEAELNYEMYGGEFIEAYDGDAYIQKEDVIKVYSKDNENNFINEWSNG